MPPKNFQNNIVKIYGDNGDSVDIENSSVRKIECIKTELVKKEGDSRLSPVNIKGSNYELDMDYVVMAIGSMPEEKIVNNLGLECDKNGYIIVGENHKTSMENVFAGGDVAKDKATVAFAARAGRDVAQYIRMNL